MTIITAVVAKRNLTKIGKTGIEYDKMTQANALFSIHHANLGQTTPMNQLITAISKGRSARKEAMIAYLRDFTRCKLDKSGKFVTTKNGKIYDGVKDIDSATALELATATPWYDYSKEVKPLTKTDLLKSIASLISRTRKFEGTVEHKELLLVLDTVVSEATDAVNVPKVKAKVPAKTKVKAKAPAKKVKALNPVLPSPVTA